MDTKNSQSNNNEDASVTRKARHVTVAASPLNEVKLDLAIIIFLSVIVAITIINVVNDTLNQILLLSGFGVIAMFWLIYKTKRVLLSHQSVITDSQHDKET